MRLPPVILVVEDYEPFRHLVCSMLQEKIEFQIAQASDGVEAIHQAKTLQPDVVLINVGLPRLNGIEAAKRIRRLVPQAKIVFVSQETDFAVVQGVFRLGARGFVHKLFVLSDLVPAIQAVLDGKRFVSNSLEFKKNATALRRHEVQFYADESIFLKRCTRFIADALVTADAAIVLATESHRDGVVQKLRTGGFNIDGAIQEGTYISLDAAETLSAIMVKGMPDPIKFSEGLRGLIESVGRLADTEDPRVAIFGECVGLLHAEGNAAAAISLEKIGNELLKTYNVDILCAYALHGQEDDQMLKSICAEHTAVCWQ